MSSSMSPVTQQLPTLLQIQIQTTNTNNFIFHGHYNTQ